MSAPLALFPADRGAYLRDHAWMAAGAMAVGMAVLWAIGNPHIWTGAVGGLAAIALRGAYLASEQLADTWQLHASHITGPGGRHVALADIAQINTRGSAVQLVTHGGEKHLIKYQADRRATKDRIQAACQQARHG